MAEAEHVALSTRIPGLILLLDGIPVRKISELTLDDVETTPARTTIKVGNLPAPIPEALLPLFHQHLGDQGNHRTMNHGSHWLFPGTRAGQHISEQSLMHRLRSLGIDIQAARNAALHDLTKEIDAASLADLLGYSTKIMNIHAARAAVPMATYPRCKQPTQSLAKPHGSRRIRPNLILPISNESEMYCPQLITPHDNAD